jgi:hypothetical protein
VCGNDEQRSEALDRPVVVLTAHIDRGEEEEK